MPRTKNKNKNILPIIIRDTREQYGYQFDTINPRPIVLDKALKTGDYSIKGLETEITIERKSLPDAYGTFGKGRHRFEHELQRMTEMNFAAVIIEADWFTILRNPPQQSQMNPKAVYASIIAWAQRYDVPFFTCPNRAFAEKTTFRLLERYWNDKEKRKNSVEKRIN